MVAPWRPASALSLAGGVALLVSAARCSSGPPSVELGTGADHFVALGDGDVVPIIHGMQGGYHVWGSVRADNLAARDLSLRFTLSLAHDSTPLTIRSDVVDLSNGEHLGTAVFLPDPTVVSGVPCRLRLDVRDAENRTASSERLITPE